MKTDPVIGTAAPTSKGAQTRTELHETAKQARDAADVAALFTAYEAAVKDRVSMEESLMTFAGMVTERKREPDVMGAVHAMKEVALAAIELAKEFAPK